MKIARPIVVTDAMLASSNIPETDYTAWSATPSYALGDRVILVDENIHQVYEAATGTSNQNKSPAYSANVGSAAFWLLVGNTNRWRMFDQSSSNQASMLSQMTLTLLPSARFDTLALLNVNAASVTVTQTSPTDGVVYNVTSSLVSPSGIQDWYDYFFEPIVRVTDFAITTLLPYADSSISITLDDNGGTVLLGELVLGLSRDIGFTQYGASVGIQDYSVKQTDAFGNAEIVERAYAKRGEFTVWVEPASVDELEFMLAGYRAAPALYLGSDSYTSTFIYGFYKAFDVVLTYPTFSICTISVEGLT